MAKSRLYSLLEAAVKETVAVESDYVCSGQPPDYASYKHTTGYIRGLNDALKLCEQIEEDMNK
jgi:hypothetical protein